MLQTNSGRLPDYVWTKGGRGQDPDFHCAGFDPELRTSVAKSKTARPVRCSWAGCKIGVFLVCAYRTGMLPADYGTEHSITAALQHKLRSSAPCHRRGLLAGSLASEDFGTLMSGA
jgi:hypothetical protein